MEEFAKEEQKDSFISSKVKAFKDMLTKYGLGKK